jgi:hypothetical protein
MTKNNKPNWLLTLAVKTYIKGKQLHDHTNEEIYWAMKNNNPKYWTDEQIKLAKKILKIGNTTYN